MSLDLCIRSHLTVYFPSSGNANPRNDQAAGRHAGAGLRQQRRLDRGRARGRRPPTRCSSPIRWTAGARASASPARPGGRRGARARARPARRAAPHLLRARARGASRTQFSLAAPALRLRRRRSPRARSSAARTAASGSSGATTSRAACASPSPPTRSPCSPTRPGIARLHRCPGRDCGWVFLDTSRPPPLVLDGDLRQPREDAPDVRAQARRRTGREVGPGASAARPRPVPATAPSASSRRCRP